ncbi:MAG: cell division protein FtsW [Bdellovibrionales bacterium GWC1_52_8]|nr:MAG: cell division protein FtsW [Bdellovibrionales bacterium GWA1_52_35]OFZ39493.1 MAG: cell division protein FtsW [Bdellovibrionales bacterium GWC1_52_8]HCM41414.1 putative lipid II flippase FtsW [Bdellovibrionales bacterium]
MKRLFEAFKRRISGKAKLFDAAVEACPWPIPAQGIDLGLLLVVLAMVAFGLLMVYSSSFIFAQERTGDGFAFIKKQLVFAVIGFGALGTISRIDYRRWSKWAYPMLGIAILLLALITIPGIGVKVGGARRWLRIAGFSFQPGEFAKFAVIFFVAYQLTKKRERLHKFVAGVLSNFLLPLPAFLLLLLQPDFGTTVMIILVIFMLLFLAGVPKRFLLGALGLALVAGTWLALGTEYRRHRVMTFLDPWTDPGGKGFQILQSFVGLHNGNFLGVGLGNGREKLFFLPEAHNDFIFAVIGEELGFVGILAVILAFVYLVHRGFKIAWDCQLRYHDQFGMLLASGITLALGLQAFVNMAVVLGLLPTKGLTLPFISYGGSALLVDLAAVGVLLSIGRGPGRVVKKHTLKKGAKPR